MSESRPAQQRFENLMSAISTAGATPKGGVERLAASAADGQARTILADWLRSAGFDVKVDGIGNLFGLKEWAPGAPWVLAGSHLDSQPKGGRLDGAYGVVAAAVAAERVLQRFRDACEIPTFNLGVVDWTNEEGARFRPSLIGSGSYVGALNREAMLAVRDDDGVSLRDALESIGYLGSDPAPAPAAAYAEIHIEQGRNLEERGVPIGLVARNWGAYKAQVVFHGVQAHTGPTRMGERRDALLAAAELVRSVRAFAVGRENSLHTSVGRLEVAPNSPNVVPALTRAYVELRSLDVDLLDRLSGELAATVARIAEATGCPGEVVDGTLRPVFVFDEGGVELARRATERAGFEAMTIDTVAGHDAVSLARICPSMLLFVPSREGISHNEGEDTDPAQLAAGVDVMTELLTALCRGELDAMHAPSAAAQ